MSKIKVTACGDIEGLKVIGAQCLREIPAAILWRLTIIMTLKKQGLMYSLYRITSPIFLRRIERTAFPDSLSPG